MIAKRTVVQDPQDPGPSRFRPDLLQNPNMKKIKRAKTIKKRVHRLDPGSKTKGIQTIEKQPRPQSLSPNQHVVETQNNGQPHELQTKLQQMIMEQQVQEASQETFEEQPRQPPQLLPGRIEIFRC